MVHAVYVVGRRFAAGTWKDPRHVPRRRYPVQTSKTMLSRTSLCCILVIARKETLQEAVFMGGSTLPSLNFMYSRPYIVPSSSNNAPPTHEDSPVICYLKSRGIAETRYHDSTVVYTRHRAPSTELLFDISSARSVLSAGSTESCSSRCPLGQAPTRG
jgi:hypothetical protein